MQQAGVPIDRRPTAALQGNAMQTPDEPRKRGSFPSTPLYLLAAFSLALPWFGAALIGVGAVCLARLGDGTAVEGSTTPGAAGWLLIILGTACIILDILIDVVWAHPGLSLTDEPTLNRPARGLVGRSAIVTEAISHGRGKVRIGDSVWIAEGPDTPAGARLRVTGASGTVLIVEQE